jgi:protein YIPF1/2
VLSRCWAALFPRANFLDVLEGNPDLYGPFWIATTVVFILFLGGTISQRLAEGGEEAFVYDFRLLSGMSCLAARLVEDEETELWSDECILRN